MSTAVVSTSPLRRLAASPGAPGLAAASLLGRIAMGMIPLALVLAVAERSYAAAGAVTGAYALGVALGGPFRGRLADRLGARPVLLTRGSGHAAALVAFAGAVALGLAGWPLAAMGLLIGATLPPTGPVMRTLWDRTLGDEELKRTAQALESATLDVGLLTGPLAVAVLTRLMPAHTTLVVTAGLTVLSFVGVAAAPAARDGTRGASGDRLGALRPVQLRRTLAVGIFAIGSLFPVEVAIVAFASEHGSDGSAGLLLGGFSLASALAGLAWASRRHGGTEPRQLVGLLLALAIAFGALALAPGIGGLAVGLVLAGAAVSPIPCSSLNSTSSALPRPPSSRSRLSRGRARWATAGAQPPRRWQVWRSTATARTPASSLRPAWPRSRRWWRWPSSA